MKSAIAVLPVEVTGPDSCAFSQHARPDRRDATSDRGQFAGHLRLVRVL
jgi:hypothetical protein